MLPANSKNSSRRTSVARSSIGMVGGSVLNLPIGDLVPTNSRDRSISQIQGGLTIQRQALGRIAKLGEYYDANNDSCCGQNIYTNDIPPDAIDLLSIAGGLAGSLDGSGGYLKSNSTNPRETSVSLVFMMKTKYESLKTYKPSLQGLLPKQLNDIKQDATHVVTGIMWGAVAICKLKTNVTETTKQKDWKAEVKAQKSWIMKIMETLSTVSVDVNAKVEKDNTSHDVDQKFEIRFYVDALPNGEDVPTTIEEAVKFMKKLPSVVRKANGGKGIPVVYTLQPIAAVITDLDKRRKIERVMRSVGERVVNDVIKMIDEMEQSQRDLKETALFLEEHDYCVPDDYMSDIDDYCTHVTRAQQEIRSEITRAIVAARYGKASMQSLDYFYKEYNKRLESRTKVKEYMRSVRLVHEKINYIERLKKKDVCYVGKCETLHATYSMNSTKSCYVFFCYWRDPDMLRENIFYFDKLIDENKHKCYFADVDAKPSFPNEAKVPVGNRICFFIDGDYLYTDLYGKYVLDKAAQLANDESMQIKIDGIDFSDNEPPSEETLFSKLSLEIPLTDEALNIMVISESDASKTAWINSLVKYSTYETLKYASKGAKIDLVPANERLAYPHSYVLRVGTRFLRFIDTSQKLFGQDSKLDDQIFISLLRYVENIPNIHAICVLIDQQSNTTESTFLTNGIQKLLIRLHQSSAPNIVFCYTDLKDTDPSDQNEVQKFLAPLNELVEKLQEHRGSFAVNTNTTYFIDAGADQLIETLRTRTNYNKKKRLALEKQWQASISETNRLLNYLASDVYTHDIRQTIMLGCCNKLAINLTKSVIGMTQNIQACRNDAKLNCQVPQLKLEQGKINHFCARLSAYARQCAVVQSENEVLREFKVAVDEERNRPTSQRNFDNKERIDLLEELQRQFEAKEHEIINQIKMAELSNIIDPIEFGRYQVELQSLPLTGKKLAYLFKSLSTQIDKSEYSETLKDFTEYVRVKVPKGGLFERIFPIKVIYEED